MTLNNQVKAIIFDWARTIFDRENNTEFPESETVLEFCKSRGLRMATVSKVGKNQTREARLAEMNKSKLSQYFEMISATEGSKDESFDEIVKNFDLPRAQILIVDDRTIRGIKYGNMHGHPTVWICKGKFAHELPNHETGEPTYTIHNLSELKKILE